MKGGEFYPLSVSKTYQNRGKNIRHRKNTKKINVVYGVLQDFDATLHFKSFRITQLQALWYKLHLANKKEFTCSYCERTFKGYVKNNKDKPEECPFCGKNWD
jgi:rubrerythrin